MKLTMILISIFFYESVTLEIHFPPKSPLTVQTTLEINNEVVLGLQSSDYCSK